MAEVNELIGGYKLRSLLQTGQVSQVFEVTEPSSGRHFAMKVLLPEAADKSEERANLFHEAEIGLKLKHDNVIKIHKVDKNPTSPFFIMEFFPAGSMRVRIQQKDFAFIREHFMKIFKQAATGLAYMHAHDIVHCDMKPDNLLVNSIGELRLIDFAISKRIPKGLARWFYRKKKPQGTPSFMAPEQIRGEILDGKADIYGLGATMYELLVGRPPFRGATINELLSKHIAARPDSPQVYDSQVSDELSELLLKMLAKKKEDRPDAYGVLMALKGIRVYKPQQPADGKAKK